MTEIENNSILLHCPECMGFIITDRKCGETICSICGLVVSEKACELDQPESPIYNNEEMMKRSRVGIPITVLTADINANLTIRRNEKTNRDFQRALRWSGTGNKRSLKQALFDLKRLGSINNLPSVIIKESAKLCRRAVQEYLLKGRSIEGITHACLYYGIRKHNHPTSIENLVSNVKDIRRTGLIKKIRRFYKLLIRQFEISVKPSTPQKFVASFVNQLGHDELLKLKCEIFTAWLSKFPVIIGKDPKGVCGAIIYLVAKEYGYAINQKTIANISGITEVTIRTRLKEIKNLMLKKNCDTRKIIKSFRSFEERLNKSRETLVNKQVNITTTLTNVKITHIGNVQKLKQLETSILKKK